MFVQEEEKPGESTMLAIAIGKKKFGISWGYISKEKEKKKRKVRPQVDIKKVQKCFFSKRRHIRMIVPSLRSGGHQR